MKMSRGNAIPSYERRNYTSYNEFQNYIAQSFVNMGP